MRTVERLALAALALTATAIVATDLARRLRPLPAGAHYAAAIEEGSDEAVANAEADAASRGDD